MREVKWLLLIACLSLGRFAGGGGEVGVLASPIVEDEVIDVKLGNSNYQSDDYDYSDDLDLETNDAVSPTVGFNAITRPAPFFGTQEEVYQAKPGDNVLLNCDVRNFQINNVVIWYKNTTIITNGQTAINNRVETMKNNSIQIANVQPDDADDYYCEVLPQKIRQHAILRIGGHLAILSDGHDVTDRSLTFKQGEYHKLECKTFLPTKTEIKWSFNGQRLSGTEGEDVNKFVLLENVNEDDAGTYQCLGDDGSPEPPHGMVLIDIHYSPKVSTHRHHVNAMSGSDAELYCDYKANPIAINHWLRNEKVLKLSDKYSIKNTVHEKHNRSVLTIKNVNINDLGIYVCQLENAIGLNKVKVNLGYEPETPQFEDMTIEGNKVTLHWLVRSLQPLSEAVLDYKLSGSYTWSSVSVIHTQRHSDKSGVWKVTHHIELSPGEWHARVKTKNTYDWSHFSPQHDFLIKPYNEDEVAGSDAPPDDLVMAGIGVGKSGNNSASTMTTTTMLSFVPFLVLNSLVFKLNC